MHRQLLAALLLAALGNAHAAGESLVEIQWNPNGVFQHSVDLAPGKFLEVCGKLAKGQVIRWQFESAAELDFNIHYHQGKDVVFPSKLGKVKLAKEALSVPIDQDYCWMWSNKGQSAASLRLQLQH